MARATKERHEYLDSLVHLMAGESPAHADICAHLVRELSMQVRDTPYRVRSKDTNDVLGSRHSHSSSIFPDSPMVAGLITYTRHWSSAS